ncbi:hypothetical protein EOD39_13107 [Acipenser ruthenus]|uniref:Uncharacterized protein n=1 Tax=Acipenser ruthenus TaxID=7906 RepID=A0A444UJH5_ACIRT|nr:hypothetical protein EOD39_13107 [Acipenser ruthenus]
MKHHIPGYDDERSAAGGVLPVAVAGQGTASGSLRGKRKAQARLPTCVHTSRPLADGPRGGDRGPPKKKETASASPPLPATRAPAATEGEKEPPPEAVWGSAKAAEPMEEAPTERPKQRGAHAGDPGRGAGGGGPTTPLRTRVASGSRLRGGGGFGS